MNEEVTRVDKLLEDVRFFAPFRERFDTPGPAEHSGVHLSASNVSQASLWAGHGGGI